MKLYDTGSRRALTSFIQYSLADRKFRVTGSFSNLEEQLEGVPQGGVLSETLFAFAISDTVKVVPSAVSCKKEMSALLSLKEQIHYKF